MATTPLQLDAQAPSEQFQAVPAPTDLPPTDLYRFLQRALCEADEAGGGILRRLLLGPSALAARIAEKVGRLPYLLDPARCPDAVVRHLAAHVGFGTGAGLPGDIADRLDLPTLRKVIALAVPFWRRRGRRDALVDMIRTLTGLRPVIDDQFWTRFLIGSGCVGAEGGPGTDLGWYTEDTADPDNESGAPGDMAVSIRVPTKDTALQSLILDLCRLAKPAGETYAITFPDFIDAFHDDIMGPWWAVLTGPVPTLVAPGTAPARDLPTAVIYTYPGIALAPGAEVQIQTAASFAWGAQRIETQVYIGNATDEIRIRFATQANGDGLEVLLNAYPDGVLDYPAMALRERVGGTVTVLAEAYTSETEPPPSPVTTTVVPDTKGPAVRTVWIDFVPGQVGGTLVRVFLDGELWIDGLFGTPCAAGTFGVAAPSSNALPVRLHRTQIWQPPLTLTTL